MAVEALARRSIVVRVVRPEASATAAAAASQVAIVARPERSIDALDDLALDFSRDFGPDAEC